MITGYDDRSIAALRDVAGTIISPIDHGILARHMAATPHYRLIPEEHRVGRASTDIQYLIRQGLYLGTVPSKDNKASMVRINTERL